MPQDKKWDKIVKIINEEYPEAYLYFALGKMFNWSPNVIDELDIKLCHLLIEIERKQNEDDASENQGQAEEEKSRSMPKEWETMSVKDILETEEFKKREKDNEGKLRLMKNIHGGQTEVLKHYVKIQ